MRGVCTYSMFAVCAGDLVTFDTTQGYEMLAMYNQILDLLSET